MPGIGFLLSAFGFVRKAAQSAFDLIRRYPALAAIIALCVALAVVWHGKGKALDQRDAALEQVAKWKTANDAATQRALAEKRAKETAANDITKGANDVRSTAKAAGTRAGTDYKLANQCLRVPAAEGDRQRTDLRGSDPLAGQFAPAPGVALVAVTPGDFDKCTSAALDLDNAFEWGQKLVAAGLAK